MVVLSHKLLCNSLNHTEGYIYILCVCVYTHTHPLHKGIDQMLLCRVMEKNALVPHAKLWCTDGGNAIKKKLYVLFIDVQIEKLCSEVDHSYYSYSSCSKKTQRATG